MSPGGATWEPRPLLCGRQAAVTEDSTLDGCNPQETILSRSPGDHMSEVPGSQDGPRGPRTELPPGSLQGRVLPASSSSWGLQASLPGRVAAPLPSLPPSTSGRILYLPVYEGLSAQKRGGPVGRGDRPVPAGLCVTLILTPEREPRSPRGPALRSQVGVQGLGRGKVGRRQGCRRDFQPTTSGLL